MHIYVAAPFSHREGAAHAARVLREADFTITSRWHDEYTETQDLRTFQEQAIADLHDIGCAQVLLMLNLASSEGKCVELGYALHAGLAILLVGERSNIFHYHPRIRLVPFLDAAIGVLAPFGVSSHETTIPSSPPIHRSGDCVHGEPLDPPPSFRGTPLLERPQRLHGVESPLDRSVGDSGALPPLTRHGLRRR